MRENTQTQLNLAKEPLDKASSQTQKENESGLDDAASKFDANIQGFFLEPIAQSNEPLKKEEKIVIVTEETEAIFKHH